MRRSPVGLAEVTDWANLTRGFALAAKGKGGRADVEAFRADLERNLAWLRAEILSGDLALGPMKRFAIRDPKPRLISAPPFRERVLHHALIGVMAPQLERSQIEDSYACRVGKGPLEAVKRLQSLLRRGVAREGPGGRRSFGGSWFAQIDIRAYFPSIHHDTLLGLLEKRFKNRPLLSLVETILRAHQDRPGRGLPIGALTSQNFANFFLAEADRALQEDRRALGYLRYMDDVVWVCRSRDEARALVDKARREIEEKLRLTIKAPIRLGRCAHGLSFCGYRITPDRLLLSRRRKRRYAAFRKALEAAFADGEIEALELQKRFDSIHAITLHAEAAAWRRAQLARAPLVGGAA